MCATLALDCYRERLRKGACQGTLLGRQLRMMSPAYEKIDDVRRRQATRHVIYNAVVHVRNLGCNFYSTCLYLFLLSVVLIIPRKEAAVAAKDSGESKDN